MTTPTDTPPADASMTKPSLRQHVSRLAAFAASPESGPAKLGFLGALLITAGGLGAGSTRQHDPLLEAIHMSWTRFGHGLVFSSILLWAGVGLMLMAWVGLGRRALAGQTTEFTMKATTGFWLVPLLVSVRSSAATPTRTWPRARCCATAWTPTPSGPSPTRTCCWTT